MPERKGLSLAREIGHRVGAGRTILILSSAGLSGEEVEVAAAFVQGAIAKPIGQSQLYNSLLNALAGRPPRISHDARRQLAAAEAVVALPPLRILVAEDNVVNQKVAQLLLRQLGQRADLATNAVAAVRALARRGYDRGF